MMTFLFLLIYILGCVAAFIYFKIDFEEQNYKYITFKENAISYAALSLFSWAGVFIIAIVRKCDSLSKVLIPFLIIVGLHASAQCPVGGDNSNPRLQHQDSLKNRSIPANAYVRVAFNKIASLSSKDTYPIDAISLSGYVLDVKYGGSETCNCHTKDKT